MVKTRHHLRRLIKKTHQLLERLKLKMHPDKTFFGCIAKGFDFLGVHFSDTPRISNTSLENHRARLARRYAQNASPACIGRYIERWTSWCSSLLRCCRKEPFNFILAGMMPNNLTGFLDGLKENENEDIFFTKNIDDYTICI